MRVIPTSAEKLWFGIARSILALMGALVSFPIGSKAVPHDVRETPARRHLASPLNAVMVWRCAMFPSALVLGPAFAGVGFLVYALVLWVLGQRRRSLALRW